MKKILTVVLLILVTSVGCAHSQEGNKKPGEAYLNLLTNCNSELLWPKFSDVLKAALSNNVDEYIKYCLQMNRSIKGFEETEETKTIGRSVLRTFSVLVSDEKPGQKIKLVAYTPQGEILGFNFRDRTPVYPSKFENYKPKTDLRVPFNDEMEVLWGGDTVEENYHAAYNPQRFALDVLIYKNGKSYQSNSKKLENYFCFGKKVVAPGSGKVISVENNIADNIPPSMNPKQPMGNHVVIDHQNGEYSYLAHLMKGSVKIKKGDQIESGDYLGKCGNSGNSSEPHIHYHIQNTPTLNHGDGLPIIFKKVSVNNENKLGAKLKSGDLAKPFVSKTELSP